MTLNYLDWQEREAEQERRDARWERQPRGAMATTQHDQWLEQRRSAIGASDSPSIVGIGYKSPYEVWEEKTGRKAPQEDNDLLMCGRYIQPAITQIAKAKWGMRIEDADEHEFLRDPEYPWLGCTLDALAEDEETKELVPVELKNVGVWNARDWDEEVEAAPLKFVVQLQHQMRVTGASSGYLIGLVGGNKPHRVRISRDDRFIQALIDERLKPFWDCVQTETPPPIDGSIACAKFLCRLHPDDNGEAVELDADAAAWSWRMAYWRDAIKEAEKNKRLAENHLKAAIGEATYGVLPDGSALSFKTQTRAEHVVQASTFRVLRTLKQLPKGVSL